MDRNGFTDRATGSLIPTIGGRKAFVPSPLPPPHVTVERFLPELTRATQAVGELKGIGRTVSNPLLLVRPLQRREAVSSSSMEGTYTTLTDLFLFEAGDNQAAIRGDTREVANYVRALEGAIGGLAELPISTRLVRDAHRVLLSGVARHRGAAVEAGELKRDQNWIGGGGRIDTARFIPAPPAETPSALDTLMAFVNRLDRPAPLIDAALAHYQFEAIHPFADGNGRVGRMLITLMLIDNGTLPQPLLYMSPYLERHKDRYIDLMYAVSRDGAWEEWIAFFLEAVAVSAEETIAVVERLQDLQREYRERFQTARRSALMLRIIDLAFERPARSISNIADALGVTYAGAANNVRELVHAGVAEEVEGSYPKLIRFPGVVAALGMP
ncbi:cell filamentation protein Fic [Arthrobacter sp. TPD3018]|nr:cell filamentation protein Fic [Sphingomonas sp. TPD3009]PVE60593.1 cell filamentation protein Fic [Arthrobacter sp. TPD3018]PVE87269.1 cell filamentation protein Fic [Sphingomonas melonis]